MTLPHPTPVLRACALALALLAAACGGGGGGGGTAPVAPPAAAQPPSTPVLTATPTAPLAGKAVAFSATSTDPAGLALSYQWDFGDGSAASGASASHTYASGGSYTVRVTATNSASVAATATTALKVLFPPTAPTVSASLASVYTGQVVTFTGAATDPNGGAVTYLWDFGDGSTLGGASVAHSYAAAGSYTVTLTASNAAGGTASGTLAQAVVSNAANTLVADCAGSACAAASPNNYAGAGTGTWRYSNTTGSAATVNLSIGGVTAGKTVTLLFSNGETTAAATKPGTGVLASPGLAVALPSPVPQSASTGAIDGGAYDGMLELNRQITERLLSTPRMRLTAALATPSLNAAPNATPAVGVSRTWNDNYNNVSPPPAYATTARAVCAAGNGRSVVIWVDPAAETSGKVTSADVTAFADAMCTNGGYAKLTALLGDAWGANAANYANDLIQDTPALQDVNVVIIDAPATPNWAGYFAGLNTFKRTSTLLANAPNSNESLVFFIKASQVKISRNYVLSSLFHEATHMINFYQRTITRNTAHDTWLEETSAMMTEDIMSPAVLGGYSDVVNERIIPYLQTGGAVSYITWPQLSRPNYALGGAFGAFLNRRYGLALYKQLVTNCNDGTGTGQVSSYACLDALIKSGGGVSFADEFAHFGATVFAKLAPGSISGGRYGYPARSDSGYALGAIDVSALTTAVPTPTALNSGYTATTHTYQVDTVPAGKTTYVRNGVSVPANTTLLVVVQ